MNGLIPCPCGQCLPCRVNRRRVWTHRIMLESFLCSGNACFLTLTYDDENLPMDGSLYPRHLQLFLKRFRKELSPGSLRYFAVGEYGDKSDRPHYHLALFGFNCSGRISVPEHGRRCFCGNCELVREAWGMGNILIDELNRKSAQYICGYVTKKMTSADDVRLFIRTGGFSANEKVVSLRRFPEFARMSTRPGIGACSTDYISKSMISPSTGEIFLVNDDVPIKLNIDGKELPLGRYLVGRLRDVFGTKEVSKAKLAEAMCVLWQEALQSDDPPLSLKQFLIDQNAGRVALIEARNQFHTGKGSL